MAWRQVTLWLGIALITAGCASTGDPSASAADRCVQSGGRWIASGETCEKAAGVGY
jgi:hypothetical protein